MWWCDGHWGYVVGELLLRWISLDSQDWLATLERGLFVGLAIWIALVMRFAICCLSVCSSLLKLFSTVSVQQIPRFLYSRLARECATRGRRSGMAALVLSVQPQPQPPLWARNCSGTAL